MLPTGHGKSKVDPNEPTPAEFEIMNAMRESGPVGVDESNWRVCKTYLTHREFTRDEAWQQVNEVARLVQMLPPVEDSVAEDGEESCVCCDNKAARTCYPCTHKVLCNECCMKCFSTFKIKPNGMAVPQCCPVCKCVIGMVV
ncbi:uncharacterized protein LOC117648084 isoform X2 [Thrips palmi]|uniref:Uncharacterized protein LOC117648084 isoform X2 n=1 Tax=Thrips palmi TaxID=161013 RepID=A0A6P8Z141_THRPL|nr:uncharacterized protein LOC117648084 isoform X2 [Thrips palmi]